MKKILAFKLHLLLERYFEKGIAEYFKRPFKNVFVGLNLDDKF